jgi:hypothetical protein
MNSKQPTKVTSKSSTAKKQAGWAKIGTLRSGHNQPGNEKGEHVTLHPDKMANNEMQNGKQKKGFHNGVKIPANRNQGGILNQE